MEKDRWLPDESRHIPFLGGAASTLCVVGQNSQENVPRNVFRKLSVLQCIMEVLSNQWTVEVNRDISTKCYVVFFGSEHIKIL